MLFGNRLLSILVFLLCLSSPALASHMAGAQMFYKDLGGDQYEVTLILYSDCRNGQPDAIASDTPAFIAVYRDDNNAMVAANLNIPCISSVTIPVDDSGSNCGQTYHLIMCTLKRTFVATFSLPPSTAGYTVVYQRCCRNGQIGNIEMPDSHGSTSCCHIPGSGIAGANNCAVFKNQPIEYACMNNNFSFDLSATDTDGDSLSYELCAPLNGSSPDSVKPIPAAPPYDSVTYIPSYFSSGHPLGMTTDFQIDAVTGLLTGKPDRIGKFIIGVRCNEWRGGVKINSIAVEFQLLATPCGSTPAVPLQVNKDTAVLVGKYVDFEALTTSPVLSYTWIPGTFLSDSTIANPVGHFTEPGVFTYKVYAMTASGCNLFDSVRVGVVTTSAYYMPTAFSPNGDGKNDVFKPFPLASGNTVRDFKVFDRKGINVYSGADGWDGTYKGVLQDMGTYYWVLVYENSDGKTLKLKGDLTLVR